MSSAREEKPVLCLGEALIDIVIRGESSAEHVGGAALNAACVLAQLGHPTQIAAWWGKDDRGEMIEQLATDNNVVPVPGCEGAEHTPVAYARLDESGRASYEFDLEWRVPPLPDLGELAHLHTGSIACTLEPGGSSVVEAVKQMSELATVSYDPNIRPALMETPEAVVERIEEIVSYSDVVKASDEDLEWLYGTQIPLEEVMRRWRLLGAGMVVVTRGPWGAYVMIEGERDMLVVDALPVELADTVGAGDSFMGGLLSGLLDHGFLGSAEAKQRLRQAHWADVLSSLHRAVIASGLTVSKDGAYAPTRDEVAAMRQAHPELS